MLLPVLIDMMRRRPPSNRRYLHTTFRAETPSQLGLCCIADTLCLVVISAALPQSNTLPQPTPVVQRAKVRLRSSRYSQHLYSTKSLGITYTKSRALHRWHTATLTTAATSTAGAPPQGTWPSCAAGLYSGASRLQKTVATSTAEAEYVAASVATKETLWLRALLRELSTSVGTIKIYTDNQAALTIIKNPVLSMRSKHIDIGYHFTRERAAAGEVAFSYIPTSEMVADCLTKAVPLAKHVYCCQAMGMS